MGDVDIECFTEPGEEIGEGTARVVLILPKFLRGVFGFAGGSTEQLGETPVKVSVRSPDGICEINDTDRVRVNRSSSRFDLLPAGASSNCQGLNK